MSLQKLSTGVAAIALGLAAVGASASPYNVNDAFVANETGGSPVDPNGAYTYGYNFTPTNPAAISTANLVHTDATGFNHTDPGVQGYYINNNAIVPAVVGNITNHSITTNFGTTLQPGQLLLHPGGTSSDAFTAPLADGDVQYVVPTAGAYLVSGSFQALSTGGTGVSVYVNGVQVFNTQDGVQGTVTPFSLTTVTLAAGQTISFVVDPGSDGQIGSDSTGLFANIALTPEPASMGLLGIGMLGLLARRRA